FRGHLDRAVPGLEGGPVRVAGRPRRGPQPALRAGALLRHRPRAAPPRRPPGTGRRPALGGRTLDDRPRPDPLHVVETSAVRDGLAVRPELPALRGLPEPQLI